MPQAGDRAPGASPPRSIGRYRILERIGQGAMGTVYAADDPSLGRLVAIKVMTGDLDDDPEIRERFYREAKVTGQLAHRNIVTVLDLGEEGGHPYIVMELLSGQSLPDYLGSETRALDTKLKFTLQRGPSNQQVTEMSLAAATTSANAKAGDDQAKLVRADNSATFDTVQSMIFQLTRILGGGVVAYDAAETVNGARVDIDAGSGGVKVDDANVTSTDIMATNGVIHVIDAVLLPPDA